MRFFVFLRTLFQRVLRWITARFRRAPRDIHGSPPQPAGPGDEDAGRPPILYGDNNFWVRAMEERVAATIPERVTFTAFWPRRVALAEWTDLLVYLATPEAVRSIFTDSERRLGLAPKDIAQQTAGGRLQRGAEVTVVPEIEDAEINPSSARVTWLEPWHHVDFRFQLHGDNPAPREGQVSFYVGPLLVGTLPLWIPPGQPRSVNFTLASPYRRIFVSYSHEDHDIVDQLEHAATAIGDTYLRDTRILRSGEEWNEAILANIDDADVFQLCWSEQAKRSEYVEQEWRYAHSLERPNFIRPMYWKEPMAAPPAELGSIHFRYVPFAQ